MAAAVTPRVLIPAIPPLRGHQVQPIFLVLLELEAAEAGLVMDSLAARMARSLAEQVSLAAPTSAAVAVVLLIWEPEEMPVLQTPTILVGQVEGMELAVEADVTTVVVPLEMVEMADRELLSSSGRNNLIPLVGAL